MSGIQIAVNATVANEREKTGIATYALNLLNSLQTLDGLNRYTVFMLRSQDNSLVTSDRFKIKPLPRLLQSLPLVYEWLLWYTWYYTGYSCQLGTMKPDVILSLDFDIPLYKKCPSVCIIYDLTPLLFGDMFPRHFRIRYKWQTKHAVGNARKIITISEDAKKDVITYFGVDSEKVVVAYPGFDSRLFKPETDKQKIDQLRAKYKLGNPYILFMGILHAKKNILRIIEAFESLKTEFGIKHKLVIAGKRAWQDEIIFDRIQSSPFRSEIVFAGYITDEEAPILMNGADVFVFPSLHEGFGIPPLEAMACGTPVITSNTSSLPEVTGDAALLVNPYDAHEMASALYRVISEPGLRETMIEKGLERVRLFSWQRTARSVLTVLEQAAQG
ncbi:MAG: glycosyltransferase family 1 protein [Dehalococcoidia bacterium]